VRERCARRDCLLDETERAGLFLIERGLLSGVAKRAKRGELDVLLEESVLLRRAGKEEAHGIPILFPF